jgi:selectin
MVARLGLGLLLLALLLPPWIYSDQTTTLPLLSNASQNTSTAPNPTNATTREAVMPCSQQSVSLWSRCLSSTSLLLEIQAKERLYYPIF